MWLGRCFQDELSPRSTRETRDSKLKTRVKRDAGLSTLEEDNVQLYLQLIPSPIRKATKTNCLFINIARP